MDLFNQTETEKKNKLWELCKKFVADNKISCPETIYQCDWVAENSSELVEKIAELVGYDEGVWFGIV